MAIVKANAYGHGIAGIAPALAGVAHFFGVASLAEAQELSGFADGQEILILGPALPEERAEIVARGFIPSISTFEEAVAFDRLATEPFAVHLIVDTGMGRIGVWEAEAVELARKIAALKNISIAAIATHLPVADEDEVFTRGQLERFEKLLEEFRSAGICAPLVHALNSAGILRFRGAAAGIVRVGLMLYGVSPVPEFRAALRPVMALKTRVTLVREVGAGRGISYGRTFITPSAMRIATLAVGYADGYSRHLSNSGAQVLLRGQRCALLGRVTMDQIMIDVTSLPEVEVGDEAVLIGRQNENEISATELAEKAGTIPWEIFTGISSRVARVFLKG